MDRSRRRAFQRVGLALVLLLAAMLVNWEVPARALGLQERAASCVYPEPRRDPAAVTVELKLTDCPRPGGTARVSVWVDTIAQAREVEGRVAATGPQVDGNATFATRLGPGTHHVATASFALTGGSRHALTVTADATVPRDGGWVRVPLLDRIVVELSPSCSLAYRDARPAGPWACPR